MGAFIFLSTFFSTNSLVLLCDHLVVLYYSEEKHEMGALKTVKYDS